jgi:hypothetical protein
MDALLVFYAKENHPEILEAFKNQELKTQKKKKSKGSINKCSIYYHYSFVYQCSFISSQ